jgi:tRNA/rRNA methyltransferase
MQAIMIAPHNERVSFVLVEPSHPGNIGAAARALKTMGFGRLVVVNARHADYRERPEALAMATGAADVLAASRHAESLVEALRGVTFACAMSGYDRQYGPPLIDLRSAALAAAELLGTQAQTRVAFVFGTERAGLTNDEVGHCQACCAIPANPAFASLNLAQAVQVAAYECQLALRATAEIAPQQRRFDSEEQAASVDAMEGFYRHLEQALIVIGYLDPDEPKTLMPRLRRLFNRARPTATELDLLRGICAAVVESRAARAGRKHGKPGR